MIWVGRSVVDRDTGEAAIGPRLVADGKVAADEIEVGRVGGVRVARDVGRQPIREFRVRRVGRLDHGHALVVERAEVADVAGGVGGDVRELAVLPGVQRPDELHRVAGGTSGWRTDHDRREQDGACRPAKSSLHVCLPMLSASLRVEGQVFAPRARLSILRMTTSACGVQKLDSACKSEASQTTDRIFGTHTPATTTRRSTGQTAEAVGRASGRCSLAAVLIRPARARGSRSKRSNRAFGSPTAPRRGCCCSSSAPPSLRPARRTRARSAAAGRAGRPRPR